MYTSYWHVGLVVFWAYNFYTILSCMWINLGSNEVIPQS